MDNVEWRVIPSFDTHEVSDTGRVRWRLPDDRPSRPGRRVSEISVYQKDSGYMVVSLCADGIRRTFRVQRLVMEAFVGRCREGIEVNHKDSDRTNNRLGNLEYTTRLENERHKLRKGRGQFRLCDRDVEEIRELAPHVFHRELAQAYSVTRRHVAAIAQGRVRVTPMGFRRQSVGNTHKAIGADV